MLSFQEEQETAFKEGQLAVVRYDDVLEKSLPNSEHLGRVRGVGGLIPITKTFGKSSTRRRRPYSASEEDIDARVDQRVEERVRGIEERLRQEMKSELERGIEERLRQEMKSELALMLQQVMSQQEKTVTPTVVHSSCQSIKQYTNLSTFTEVKKIQI